LGLSIACTTQQAAAEYQINIGDIFKFYIETMNDLDGFDKQLTYRGVPLYENASLKIQFSIVSIPYIKYIITVDGISAETTLLNNIFVQDTNWTAMTLEYEAYGYEVFENETIWGVRQDNSTILNINFNKTDGVLEDFYAYNESQLVSLLGIGEFYIYRTEEIFYPTKKVEMFWLYSIIALVPTSFLIKLISKHKNKTKGKM
jgi:hypothetical protein